MAIDDCPYTFKELASAVLPDDMQRMRRAMKTPFSIGDCGQKGIGSKTVLHRLGRSEDFPGCYVFQDGRKPIYVGISRKVVQRLLNHTKGRDYYSASLAYRMTCEERGKNQSANDAMKDRAFMAVFESKKAYIASLNVAIIEIEDPIEMYLFEVYCAMQLNTSRWNSFRTH